MNSLLKMKTCNSLRRAVTAAESSGSIRTLATVADGGVKPASTSLSQFGGVHGTKSGTAKMW